MLGAVRRVMALAALLVLATALPGVTAAQTVYPVLVQQTPPTSFGRLSDLTNAAAQTWSVTLVLQDTREPSLPVALRVNLTGNRFSARTTDPLRAPLVTLNPGVPVVLTAADLAPYLAPGNVTVRGADPAAFFQGGAVLPEGVYQLCVEVVPVGRPGSISIGGNGCTMALAQSYDPPQFTTPLDRTSVLVTDLQNVQMAWQHVGPAPPGAVYTLKIYEVPPNDVMSTSEIILRREPLFSRLQRPELTFLYGATGEPVLNATREYVAQVRVEDLSGRSAIANRGFSRPIRFTYGQGSGNGCLPPISARVDAVGQTEAVLSWVPPAPQDETYIGTVVQVADQATGQGFSYTLNGESGHHVRRLSQARTYEYSVQGICLGGRRSPGLGGTFQTQSSVQDNPRVEDCGAITTAVAETSGGAAISVGDKLTYKGFQIVVKDGTQAGTGFTGQGTFIVPWLEQGLLAIDMTDVVAVDGAITGGTLSPIVNTEVPPFDPSRYSAEFGDESCDGQYTDQQVDGKGFYPDGIHYVTGTTTDPRGFDQDGNWVPNGPTDPIVQVDDRGFNQDGLFVNEDGTTGLYDPTDCDLDGYTKYGLPCGTTPTNLDQILDDATDYYTDGLGEGGLVDVVTDAGISQLPPELQGAANAVRTALEGEDFDTDAILMAAVAEVYLRITGDTMPELLTRYLQRLNQPADLAAVVGGIEAPREMLLGVEDSLLVEGGPRAYFPDGLPEQLPTDGRDPDVVAYENLVIGVYEADQSLALTRAKADVLELWDDFDGTDYLLDLVLASIADLDANGELNVQGITELLTNPDPEALFDRVLDIILDDLEQKANNLIDDGEDDGFGSLEWRIPAREWLSRPHPDGLWGSTERYSVAYDPEAGQPGIRDLLPPPSRDPLLGFQLPIKLEKRTEDGKTYTLVLEEVNVPAAPNADVTVSAYGILPVEGKPGEALVFQADDLPIGFNGFDGDAKLSLVSAVSFGLGGLGTFSAPAQTDPRRMPRSTSNSTATASRASTSRASCSSVGTWPSPWIP